MDDRVTIVNGLRGAEQRILVPVIGLDDDWLFVEADGASRRFSRATGFEHTEGGGWSTWRLSGSDYRRYKRAE